MATNTQFISPDEAFRRIYGEASSDLGQKPLLSPDEAFLRVFGEKATQTPLVQGSGVEGLVGKYDALAPTPIGNIGRPVMSPVMSATLQEATGSSPAAEAPAEDGGLPEATAGRVFKGGVADTLNSLGDVSTMNTAEIEETRKSVPAEEIWNRKNLTDVERVALLRASQGDEEMLAELMKQRGATEAFLKEKAAAVDPGEYAMPTSDLGRFAHDVVRSAPYTLMSLIQNAPLALMGPIGAAAGGVMGAANEAQQERAGVYHELRKRGMSHAEAYAKSDPVNWQNMATLSASDIAQNLLTFGAKKLFPGAGGLKRALGAIVGDMLLEGAEEGGQKFIADKAQGDKTDMKELAYESMVGGASGGLFGAGGAAISHVADRVADRRAQAKQNAQKEAGQKALFEVVDAIRKTEVAQKAPQAAPVTLPVPVVPNVGPAQAQPLPEVVKPEATTIPASVPVKEPAVSPAPIAQVQQQAASVQQMPQQPVAPVQQMLPAMAPGAQAPQQQPTPAQQVAPVPTAVVAAQKAEAVKPPIPESNQGAANVPAAPDITDDTLRPAGTPPVPGNGTRIEGGSPHAGVTAVSSMKLPDSENEITNASEGRLPPQGRVHEESIKQPETPVNEAQSPSRRAAQEVADRLKQGGRIGSNRDLFDITDRAFGGTQAEGKYTVRDAYDAMELGVNLYLREKGYNPSGATSVEDVRREVGEIEGKVLSAIPTQANRTAEQMEFQQFSTPPNLSYVANWLLRSGKGDTVLEPSAGIGGLAVYAKNSGATVVVNEFSKRRAELLREMGFDEVHIENAEQLHNILPDSVKPNRVIMNPPFSSTAGRIQGERKTKNATLHVEQALKRLEPGGRAVLILGKGMADDAPAFQKWWRDIKKEYNVRANIELSGKDYRKYGTSFGNVLAVIDKTGATPAGGTVTGKYESVLDALEVLEPVRNDYAAMQEASTPTKPEVAERKPAEARQTPASKPKAEKPAESEASPATETTPETENLMRGNTPEVRSALRLYNDIKKQAVKAGRPQQEARDIALMVTLNARIVARAMGTSVEEAGRMMIRQDESDSVGEGDLPQSAYHGSPYRFDRFQLSKIGTGEGMQGFGWGIYFAGNREIAEYYRETLTDRKNREKRQVTRLNGKEYEHDWQEDCYKVVGTGERASKIENTALLLAWNIENDYNYITDETERAELVSELIDSNITYKEDSLSRYEEDRENRNPETRDNLIESTKRELDFLKTNRDKIMETVKAVSIQQLPDLAGQLYSVDIPESDVLLDNDLSISEQPPTIRETLKKVEGTHAKKVLASNGTGLQFYDALARDMKSPKAASEYLDSLGIPGLQFWDGSSRSSKEGMHNYVIWNEDSIRDLETYYQREQGNTVPYGEQLHRDEQAWAKAVDDVLSKKASWDEYTKVITTPLVLHLTGARVLPVYMYAEKISKAMREHDLSRPMIKQLPGALADPIAVFKSTSDGLVVMTELQDKNGATIVVPFHLNHDHKRDRILVNKLASIYGKERGSTLSLRGALAPIAGAPGGKSASFTKRIANNQWFVNQINDGKLCYLNKEKFTAWSKQTGLPLPAPTAKNRIADVPTEADLADYRETYDGKYQTDEKGTYRGAVSFDPATGLPTVRLFKAANESTLAHELGHIFARNLQVIAGSENAPEWAVRDWNTLKEWVGWTNDQTALTRDQHEQLADGFLNYLNEGKAPTSALRDMFKRFAKWFRELFRQGQIQKLEMSDAVRDVYARMLATQEEIDAGRAPSNASATPEENIRRGREAMERVRTEQIDVRDAIHRDDLGGISFIWGETGKPPYYNDGSGISHVEAKRRTELREHLGKEDVSAELDQFFDDLVDAIATGEKGEKYLHRGTRPRVNITKGPHTVVLGLVRQAKEQREEITWVVTGWDERIPPLKKKKSRSDNSAEEQGSSESTRSETTPSVTEREQSRDFKESVTPDNQVDKNRPAMEIERKSRAERAEERAAKAKATPEEDNAVYDDYTPAKLKIKGAKPHPADLVQSAAMAAVDPPEPTYSPRLPKEVIDSGKLSEAQLEAVVYAGQSFTQTNADGTRRGFFIGDGTGVGKGREISGILMDQLAQGHGNGKAVWVSAKVDLNKDAKRDWEGIGNDPDDIFTCNRLKGTDSIGSKHTKGIAFTAYTQLRNADRRKQLTDWLGKNFDGVIVLDEAHNANNAMSVKAERGTKTASQQALGIMELVAAFPKARVLYVTATGATEVRNLAMLDRLGLWGEGTAFPNKSAFVSSIEKGGTAAMELVARDMKAMGLYIARSISYRAGKHGGDENVTFRRLEHSLNEHQTAVYDRIAEAWQVVLNNIDRALEVIAGKENKNKAAGDVIGTFWNAHQRALNQIVTAIQTPSVVNAIKKDLAEGKSAVVQLTNTNAAEQERALNSMKEDESLDDLDLTPKDALLNFLKNSFPVEQQHEVADEDGNKKMVTVHDSKGNPVLNKEAVAMREQLIRDIESISFPDSPLDMIINAFGPDAVAEATGRGRRVVTRNGKRVVEKRPLSARTADAMAFQNGDKRILIFSDAGGTGFSYHADRAAKNQQKRVHYLLQPGWKADAAIQGLGRTHRSNEVHKPEYVLVTTDLPGQKRFISTIARRLEQLGALTTGERKSATQGLFSERDNLESAHAQRALERLFETIIRTGIGNYSSVDLLQQMGFSRLLDPETRRARTVNMPKIQQFLNRLLSLKHDAQQAVFAEFERLLDFEIASAAARGELDVGTETLRADSIEVLQETTVYSDEASGIETKYVGLETSHRQYPVSFGDMKGSKFYVSKRTGKILAARETKATVTDPTTGEIEKQYLMTGVDPAYKGKSTEKALANEAYYTPLSLQDAKKQWAEEAGEFPEFRTEKKHLITGALLPIWDRLEGHPRIMRVTTKDGQTFLGRLIEPASLLHTLRALGTEYNGKAVAAAEVLKEIEKPGNVAVLANGWKIRRARVNGENRIELIGPDFSYRRILTGNGLFCEAINWKERWFIPAGDEGKVEAVLKISPVVEMRSSDVLQDAAAVVNEGVEPFDANDYGGMSVKDVSGLRARENIFAHEAENTVPALPESGFAFEDEKTEARYRAAKAGVQRAGALRRIGDAMKAFTDGLKSDFPKLVGQKFDSAREALRRMNRRRSVAVGEAITTLRRTLKEMTPQEYDLFSRKRILDDLMFQKNEMPDSALPYGFTDEQLEREHERVAAEAAKSEKIRDAVAWEEHVVREINKKMIAAADALGWHTLSQKFSNPHYFRHVVPEYANAAAEGRKAGLTAPENRGYMKKREGSEKDISANYVQAMGEVRALQLQDIETLATLRELKDEYDICDRLKRAVFVENEARYLDALFSFAKSQGMDDFGAAMYAEKGKGELNKKQAIALSRLFAMAKRGELPEGKFSALVREMAEAGSAEDLTDSGRKQLHRYLSWLAGLGDEAETIAARTYFKGAAEKKQTIKGALGERHLTWRDAIPDGYVEWHPFQNRMVFSVNTVAEDLVAQALEAGLEELNIPVDMLEKMRVMGGFRQTWVIPQELAETLDRIGKPTERTALGAVAKEMTTQWKEWVLHSPMRAFRYNVRNITGDADAVLAGNPDAFRFMGQAFKELADVYVKGMAPTGELAEYTKRGGNVGAQHVQDLGDLTSVREFMQLMEQGEKGLLRLPKKYWRMYWSGARRVSDFRENLLRYATYLSYLEQMKKDADGKPRNWGASKRNEVMENRDIRDRAFKMANELLGAYDQVSETGRQLRDVLLPFYSWMEVNLRRYAQIFRNGIEDGDIGDVAKRTVLGQAMKAPVYAWRVGKTALKVSLLWTLIQAFNRAMHGDEEDDLPPDVQGRPHIVLGRGADGSVIYFDRLGAFADVLDWLALDSAYTDIRDILNGHQTLGDYAKKMAQAPVSKIINAMNPLIKSTVEVVSGKQYYPDAFNPRSIRDLGMYMAGTIGLTPEFVALTGRPGPGYLKSRAGGMFAYVLDPEEAAYWWILDKKRQFQENVLGTSWSGFSTSARGMALANIKKAIRYGDRKALTRYAREYAKFDGTDEGLMRSIGSMDPLSGLSKENQVKFYRWLTPQDRRYLSKAAGYYRSLLSGIAGSK